MDELIKELKTSTKKKNRINLRGGDISPHKSPLLGISKMMSTTCTFYICAFDIFAPFVYLNLGLSNITFLEKKICWGVFFFFFLLVVRAIGGFVTTTLIQLLIQRRIPTNTLSNVARCLIQMLMRPFKSLKPQEETSNMMHNTWLFVFLISLVTSVVGIFLDILRFNLDIEDRSRYKLGSCDWNSTKNDPKDLCPSTKAGHPHRPVGW